MPLRTGRIWRVTPLVAVFAVALDLSACSGRSTPGVLTSADIPSYLGVRPTSNGSQSVALGALTRSRGCRNVRFVVFTQSAQGALQGDPATAKSLAVLSTAVSCPDTADAQSLFGVLVMDSGSGRSIPGLGDDAKLFNVSKRGIRRAFDVVWRQGNQVDVVSLGGPTNAKRVTTSLTELLARRAAVNSS